MWACKEKKYLDFLRNKKKPNNSNKKMNYTTINLNPLKNYKEKLIFIIHLIVQIFKVINS